MRSCQPTPVEDQTSPRVSLLPIEALEPVALKYQDSLFRNGEVVMASQIMVSKNPNTILYDKDSLRTVLAISL